MTNQVQGSHFIETMYLDVSNFLNAERNQYVKNCSIHTRNVLKSHADHQEYNAPRNTNRCLLDMSHNQTVAAAESSPTTIEM